MEYRACSLRADLFMPDRPMRPCHGAGCPELTTRRYCPACATRVNTARRSSRTLTYTEPWWLAFRRWFFNHLIALGIVPVCGAALPDGPSMWASQCRASGVLNAKRLELDHDPPLTEAEKGIRRVVCDVRRVGWLCRSCHSAKTAREMARA